MVVPSASRLGTTMPDHAPTLVDYPWPQYKGSTYILGCVKALMRVVGAEERGTRLRGIDVS
jgi:hypothetical protein